MAQFWLEEDLCPPSFTDISPEAVSLAAMDAISREEYWGALAFRYCRGIGARTRVRLVRQFGSSRKAIEARKQWRELGIPDSSNEAMASGAWREQARKEWDSAFKTGYPILLWNHPLYPARLRQLPDFPLFLYCDGNQDLLTGPVIAIVGSRNASTRNENVARTIAGTLSGYGITIISGMAMGIDYCAHSAALEHVGKSIGALGTGIDIEYPALNRKLYYRMRQSGLLLSEFPPGSPPVSRNFPIRNRIISGISLGIVVVEAALRSGSLITARLALEQNREVFAVPGAALESRSQGCQNLVREGARPVFSVDDILRHLEPELRQFQIKNPVSSSPRSEIPDRPPKIAEPSEPEKAPPSEEEAAGLAIAGKMAAGDKSDRVLACLRKLGPIHIDNLAGAADLTLEELNPLLTCMEMLGQARRLPGARFEAIL